MCPYLIIQHAYEIREMVIRNEFRACSFSETVSPTSAQWKCFQITIILLFNIVATI